MVVRLKPGYQSTTFVRLEGQVSRPGTYPIIKEDYTIYDLFMMLEEALEGANLKGVFYRAKEQFLKKHKKTLKTRQIR